MDSYREGFSWEKEWICNKYCCSFKEWWIYWLLRMVTIQKCLFLYLSLGSFLSGKSPREKDFTTLDGACPCTSLLVNALFPKSFSLLGNLNTIWEKYSVFPKANKRNIIAPLLLFAPFIFFFALPDFALFRSVSAPLPPPSSEKKCLACAAHKF